MDDDTVAWWSGDVRQDGMMVRRATIGWIVITPDQRPPVNACPCCKKVLATATAAKRVANAVYPPPN